MRRGGAEGPGGEIFLSTLNTSASRSHAWRGSPTALPEKPRGRRRLCGVPGGLENLGARSECRRYLSHYREGTLRQRIVRVSLEQLNNMNMNMNSRRAVSSIVQNTL